MALFKRSYAGKRVETNKDGFSAPIPFKDWWGRRRLAVRVALIAAAAVLALSMGLALAVRLYIRPPEDMDIVPNLPSPSPVVMPSGASPEPSPTDGGEPSPQEFVKRDGVYTFLLAGANEGLTDTLMVATLDTNQNTCHVLSIPRDTPIANAPRTVKKINSAYSQQKNVEEPGLAQLKLEIATLIGFQPQYAAVVDYNGFKRLIKAIDGIDFYVPMNMRVDGEGINLQKGQQHLNADQALQLVRFRVNHYDGHYGAGYDDYGRMEMQQQVLTVAAKKALSNWGKFPEYIDIAQENVTGDIDWGRMLWFAEQVNNIGLENVVFHVLPTYSVQHPAELDDGWYEAVKAEEALELINATINPFTLDITADMLEYMVLTER